jgi:hypothetical protein
MGDAEYDHVISLQLGGDPNTLTAAQRAIVTDWTTALSSGPGPG